MTKVWKRYLTVKCLAKTLQPTWLKQKANDYELQGLGTKAGHLCSLISNKESQNNHKQIQYSLGKLSYQDATGSLHIIQDKQPLDTVIMKENKVKYMLSYNTPPLTAPLVNILGTSGLTNTTTQIANGSFIPPSRTDK